MGPPTVCTSVEFFEYLTFLCVCVAGVAHASWRWIIIGGLVLFLLGWPRWKYLVAKAGDLDAQYRELGRMALVHRLFGTSLSMYGKARYVIIVVGGKIVQDTLFLAGAYVFGVVIARLWGVP